MTSLSLHQHVAAAQSADQRRAAAECRRSHEIVERVRVRAGESGGRIRARRLRRAASGLRHAA